MAVMVLVGKLRYKDIPYDEPAQALSKETLNYYANRKSIVIRGHVHVFQKHSKIV